MSSARPLRVHDIPEEAKRIRQETHRLLAELNGRRPAGALLVRAKDLRQRRNVLVSTVDRMLCHEMAITIAFKERTSRNIEEGDDITPEDEKRAAEIVSSFGLKAGTC